MLARFAEDRCHADACRADQDSSARAISPAWLISFMGRTRPVSTREAKNGAEAVLSVNAIAQFGQVQTIAAPVKRNPTVMISRRQLQ
jgi:hypothetical protein